MANGDAVAENEELIRGLFDPLYCTAKDRPASNAFCGPRASVNRTAVLSYDEILEVMRANRKPGTSPVVMTCAIHVFHLTHVCKKFPDGNLEACVVEDSIAEPLPAGEAVPNHAHAEIRAWEAGDVARADRRLTVAMSKELLRLSVQKSVSNG